MVSLAIGREGQNSRLAARLTGWRINIRDSSAPEALQSEAVPYASDGMRTNREGDTRISSDDLTALTVAELRSFAANRGISLTGIRRKAEIIDAIQGELSPETGMVLVNTEGDE